MQKRFPPTAEHLDAAAAILRDGGLIGMPTETVYGLAGNATDDAVVDKIFTAKGRPANNPLIIHVADADAARRWTGIDAAPELTETFQIAAKFWPGPLTLVVPRGDRVDDRVTGGGGTVAVRVPDHPVALDLLRRCDFPIAAPSANVSNYISPTTALHVIEGLGDAVEMVIDGGRCRCGLESTILELNVGGPRLLRPGGLDLDALTAAFGMPIERVGHSGSVTQAMPAPGMFPKHYSPSKPLRLVERGGTDRGMSDARVGLIVHGPVKDVTTANYTQVWTLSESGDEVEAARNLYAVLRQADASDCERLDIEVRDETGLGAAIMDRIGRAAGR